MGDAVSDGPRVWRYSRQIGSGPTLGFIGSGPLAILAGFDLGAAVSVAQRPGNSTWHQLALASLGLGVSSLVVTLLIVVTSQLYWATPDQRLAWRPEATVSAGILEEERRAQLADYHLLVKYYNRVGAGLIVGLLSTLAGLAATVLAETRGWGAIVASCLLTLSGLVVVLWRVEKLPVLFPGVDQADVKAPPPALDATGVASVVREGSQADVLQGLLREADSRGVLDLFSDGLALVTRTCDAFRASANGLTGMRVVEGESVPAVQLGLAGSSSADGVCCYFSASVLAASRGRTAEQWTADLPPGISPNDDPRHFSHRGWVRESSILARLLA